LRKIIAYIAKKIYREKYRQLKRTLLIEYSLIEQSHSSSLDILSKLLISGEDHRFYHHIGFDIIAILRAIRNRVLYKKIEGASTIEQQLVRVLTNNFERSFHRKIQEILLSTTLTSIVPKKVIPSIYLNIAYYGSGMNGLTQAINKLGIDSKNKMPIEQAAEIVSRIKYPQTSELNIKRILQIEKRKHHLMSL